MARLAPPLLALLVMPACATLNDLRVEERWDEPVYFEVSRTSSGLELQVERAEEEGVVQLSVVERFDCVEEATQLGSQSVYAKPNDVVLGVAGVLGALATAAAITFGGSAVVDQVLERQRADVDPNANPPLRSWQQPRSATAQLVGAGVGIVGVGTQALLSKKIVEWLKLISFEEHRPVHRELGRQVPACDRALRSGVLRGPRLPPDGLLLKPRATAPKGFLPREGLTLDGVPLVEPRAALSPAR
ncbi:MAG: hypothetical protein IPJ65_10315 [Archangiaceae bacterium]|nr:hypothetical protein [Archangiaceae bacterium]